MRIFSAVRHSSDPRFYYGGLWTANFCPALRQLNHELVESKVDLLPASRFMHIANKFSKDALETRAYITQSIIEEVRKANKERPLDLFLSYFYNSHFDPLGFDEIHSLGIPTVNFYCNSLYQIELVAAIASRVRFSWHPEKEARSLYLEAGANPVWVQMAADPHLYHPIPDAVRQAKACFVGQRYCDRDRWLAHLAHRSIPVDIYGSGWLPHQVETATNGDGEHTRTTPRPGGMRAYLHEVEANVIGDGLLAGSLRTFRQYLYAQQTRRLRSELRPHAKGCAGSVPEVISQYEVVLNFSNVWSDGRSGSRLIPHVRLRDFEAPMCRTCYLTGHTEEITEFFEVGKEIETYETRDELVDKTQYYLKHPADAERLRSAGHARALSEHTWKHRFQELFVKTNLQRKSCSA